MNNTEKQALIFTGAIVLGVLFIVTGLTQFVHDSAISVLKPFYSKYADEKTDVISPSVGYTAEFIVAFLIMLSPFSATAAVWLFKISFDLTLGKSKGVNVFVISPKLNWIMATLAIILFGYSLYLQYIWTLRLTKQEVEKKKEDELAKFI